MTIALESADSFLLLLPEPQPATATKIPTSNAHDLMLDFLKRMTPSFRGCDWDHTDNERQFSSNSDGSQPVESTG